MSEPAPENSGSETGTTPPSYRVMILDPEGAVLSTRPISARTDDEAVLLTCTLVDGHAVELWDGLRFIEHFDRLRTMR